MKKYFSLKNILVLGILLISIWGIKALLFPTDKVDFNTDIRPILNQHCLPCHGGVKASGGLSFLFEEDAFAPTDSERPAIIPGNASGSELIRRIKHQDLELRMPLEADPLSAKEIQILTQWINQGAKWAKHWAYIPPKRPTLPKPSAQAIFPLNNEIDHFILARLNENELPPSPITDKTTLLRRLSLDIIGLPPSTQELNDFLNDSSPTATEKVVDRLLASPHFGERWAAMWMDLARYGDSQGYQKDPYRSIWRYRDWLIDAFNKDLPFDQFTLQQLAGDLVEEAGEEELLATAFHRNTMTNDEGGTDDEEFRVAAVIDRINTTWEVWQGTTMSCVQCHSHPYDPIRHEDFYTSMAFFNNTEDADTRNDSPNIASFAKPDKERIKRWVKSIADIEVAGDEMDSKELNKWRKMSLFPVWRPGFCEDWGKVQIDANNLARRFSNGAWLNFRQVQLGNTASIQLKHSPIRQQGLVQIYQDSINGTLLGSAPLSSRGTTVIPLESIGKVNLYFHFTTQEDRFPRDFVLQEIHFDSKMPQYAEALKDVADSLASLTQVMTPIMKDLPPASTRKTHLFERGNWLVHGQEVSPGVPASLSPLPKQEMPDRMDLAKWLIHPENPLTARVIANRFWAELMGRGIVETVEDFGSQGTPPSHPQLLDWLALSFQEDLQWSVKALVRQIVLSSSYQQSSSSSKEALAKDPNNRYWSRAYRKRLTAEQVRDQALAVSGLLSEKMYGPSVMPPQPDGVWQVIRQVLRWRESGGEDRYRRALYTFWRKSSPYPSFLTFDSPSREYCVSRRIPTNTPLQALVTMNDTVYVEAARALAQLSLDTDNEDTKAVLTQTYKQALLRAPTDTTLDILNQHYAENLAFYQANPIEAQQMAQSAEGNAPQLAALTVVSNVILNLDEFVVRE